MVNIQNESFDLLVNGSVIDAAIKSYEEVWTFAGVVWLWPIVFIFLLTLVAIKTENPTMVGIFVILGGVALSTRLDAGISATVFGLVLVLSILVWLYSLFVSPRTDG